MNEVGLIEIESLAPVALGALFMYGLVKLNLRKNTVKIYIDDKRQPNECGEPKHALIEHDSVGVENIKLTGTDRLDDLATIYWHVGDLNDSSYWSNYVCKGLDFRSCVIGDTVYDEFIVNGKFVVADAKNSIVDKGVKELGIFDLSNISSRYRLLGGSFSQNKNATIALFESSDMICEISKYSENSGLMLMLLQDPNVNIMVMK